jgi:hypothetical protein
MFDRRIRPVAAVVLLAAATAMPAPALAVSPQGAATVTPRQAVEVQSQAQGSLSQNANETRQDFYEVLEQYPPALGRVLRLDPTLMTNQAYLASYPNLAAFFARYPDVPRNPGYYLERYEANYSYNQPTDARGESMRLWRDALEFMAAFSVFGAVVFALYSFLKYVVEYRRWGRVSKVNAEVHNKILDRFASNDELLAYVDSPAGRRFLEATPIAPNAAPVRSVGAPFGRILLSVQVGIVLLALAAGFLVISGYAIEEVRPVLVSLAALGFCLGIGSIVSAGASYLLSRKLGLLPAAAEPRTEQVG